MISKRIEMHLKYFEYMGLTSAKNMTHNEQDPENGGCANFFL
jgi:hypothetical protein